MMFLTMLRKAQKLLPNECCGQGSGHKRHVWEDRRTHSDRRGELVFCEGIPLSPAERFDRKLRWELDL